MFICSTVVAIWTEKLNKINLLHLIHVQYSVNHGFLKNLLKLNVFSSIRCHGNINGEEFIHIQGLYLKSQQQIFPTPMLPLAIFVLLSKNFTLDFLENNLYLSTTSLTVNSLFKPGQSDFWPHYCTDNTFVKVIYDLTLLYQKLLFYSYCN
jgi:hypothetical protein